MVCMGKQIVTLADLVGKTIANVYPSNRRTKRLLIEFTDDTFVVITKEWAWEVCDTGVEIESCVICAYELSEWKTGI